MISEKRTHFLLPTQNKPRIVGLVFLYFELNYGM